MAEYWKSTPRYWCKFCEIYVRDTSIERKNHEASAKHQNSIQRSLRGLHNEQAKQQREQQQAKNEVARLNGLVGSRSVSVAKAAPVTFTARSSSVASGPIDMVAHRRAQAQQLIAMGMQVPDELKETGASTGKWQTVSERVITTEDPIVKLDLADTAEARVKGVHKRKAEPDGDAEEEQSANKRRIWGSSLKTYPGQKDDTDNSEDLDVLLSGISKKKIDQQANTTSPKETETADDEAVKREGSAAAVDDVKGEDDESAITAPPVVAFKKRKGKR